MFSKASPARDIEELAGFLHGEHDAKCIYRGQTRYHEPCIPTAFRPFIKDIEGGWVRLHDAKAMPWAGVPFEAERLEVRSMLGRVFDRGLANILAQQYGLTSDMLDVTASIALAAFFATRTAPTYQPHDPRAEGEELGVIYRARLKVLSVPLEIFTSAMEQVYALSYQTGQKIFFTEMKRAGNVEYGEAKNLLNEYFPNGWDRVELLKSAFYCHPTLIESIFDQKSAFLPNKKSTHSKDRWLSAREAYATSRLVGEVAGVVSPPLRYAGVVSRVIQARPWEGDPNWLKAEPSLAVVSGVEAVFDLNRNPLFEAFFFRHDPDKAVHIDGLDKIWPTAENDLLFGYLRDLALSVFEASKRAAPKDLDQAFFNRDGRIR